MLAWCTCTAYPTRTLSWALACVVTASAAATTVISVTLRIGLSWTSSLAAQVAIIDSLRHQGGENAVSVRPTISIELPGAPPLSDEIEVAVGDQDLLVGPGLGDQLTRRVKDDAAAVVDVVTFLADAIKSRDEIFVEDRVGAQLLLPHPHRQALVGRGAGHQQYLGPVEC